MQWLRKTQLQLFLIADTESFDCTLLWRYSTVPQLPLTTEVCLRASLKLNLLVHRIPWSGQEIIAWTGKILSTFPWLIKGLNDTSWYKIAVCCLFKGFWWYIMGSLILPRYQTSAGQLHIIADLVYPCVITACWPSFCLSRIYIHITDLTLGLLRLKRICIAQVTFRIIISELRRLTLGHRTDLVWCHHTTTDHNLCEIFPKAECVVNVVDCWWYTLDVWILNKSAILFSPPCSG